MDLDEAKQILFNNGFIAEGLDEAEERKLLSDVHYFDYNGVEFPIMWVTLDYIKQYKEALGHIPGDGKLVLFKDAEKLINQLLDIIKKKDQEIAELKNIK